MVLAPSVKVALKKETGRFSTCALSAASWSLQMAASGFVLGSAPRGSVTTVKRDDWTELACAGWTQDAEQATKQATKPAGRPSGAVLFKRDVRRRTCRRDMPKSKA